MKSEKSGDAGRRETQNVTERLIRSFLDKLPFFSHYRLFCFPVCPRCVCGCFFYLSVCLSVYVVVCLSVYVVVCLSVCLVFERSL